MRQLEEEHRGRFTEFRLMKPRKFVILTTQRTGSTVIALWLNNHPHVRCHSEVFYLHRYKAHDGMPHFCLDHPLRKWLYRLCVNRIGFKIPVNFVLDRLIDQFLDSLYNNPAHSAPWTDTTNWLEYHPRTGVNLERAVGFKVMYTQLHQIRRLDRLIHKRNISVIHLIRENLLNIHVSSVRKRLTGQAHTSGTVKRPQVTLNVVDLVGHIERLQKRIDVYRERYKRLPYIEVTYEQFLTDLPAFKNMVLDFLGIDDVDIPMPPLKRISSGELRNEITNYGEIEEALSGTPYEKYLLPASA